MNFAHENATKRIIVLMTRTQKVRLEAKAGEAVLSVSEFVRRAVDAYDPEEMRQRELLAAAFRNNAERTSAPLDRQK